MNYDCIIIGGGISALTCAIRLQSSGAHCAVIASGMGAMHFSSGSIDVLGYNEHRKPVYRPLDYMKEFIRSHPMHPYALCGVDTAGSALGFLSEQLAMQGLDLYRNGDANHFHVTNQGTLKPTFYSQRSVFNERIAEAFAGKSKICVLNFDGYRDFHPELAIANLRNNSLFRGIEITCGKIVYPDYGDTEKNPFEYRSVDIARIFDTEKYLEDIAGQIRKVAGDARFASLPAFIGIDNYRRHHQLLEELTGLIIYEVPTLPPSILGMRIDNALKSRFASLGGVFIAGDRVAGGEIKGGLLDHVHTDNYGSARLHAGHFVMATGSFFSGGLVAEPRGIREPLFNLRVSAPEDRRKWYSPSFFERSGHPFLEFGVETDEKLHPYTQEGIKVGNLHCAGALLAHYNPIIEGSGGGIAVTTAYHAAQSILAER